MEESIFQERGLRSLPILVRGRSRRNLEAASIIQSIILYKSHTLGYYFLSLNNVMQPSILSLFQYTLYTFLFSRDIV
jgi:hypothetical protein